MLYLNSALFYVRPVDTSSAIITTYDASCIVSPVLLPVTSLQCVISEANHKASCVDHVCPSMSVSLNIEAAIRSCQIFKKSDIGVIYAMLSRKMEFRKIGLVTFVFCVTS